MSKIIQHKMEKAIEYTKELTSSLLIKSMFPEIKFPVSKHVITRELYNRHNISRRSEQAVGSHLIDSAEVKYPLTIAQYDKFPHQMFSANKKEWDES